MKQRFVHSRVRSHTRALTHTRTLQVLRTQVLNGKTSFFVHYQGWNKRWDEWLDDTRVMGDNERTRALQARVNEEVKAAQSRKAKAAAESAAASGGGNGGGDAATAGKRRNVDASKETESEPADPAVMLVLPFALKRHLVDDWENVTQKCVVRQRAGCLARNVNDARAHTHVQAAASAISPAAEFANCTNRVRCVHCARGSGGTYKRRERGRQGSQEGA